MSGLRWAESILLLLPVRLVLAGMFGYAAWLKLNDPQAFAFAIKAFDIFDPISHDHAIVLLAFGIPWAEMIVAVLLLLGLWTRGAGMLLAIMLAGFTAGMLSLIARGIDTECACFGEADVICSGPVGWCHIGRNAALLLGALLLTWRGGGLLGLDPRPRPRPVDDDETAA